MAKECAGAEGRVGGAPWGEGEEGWRAGEACIALDQLLLVREGEGEGEGGNNTNFSPVLII